MTKHKLLKSLRQEVTAQEQKMLMDHQGLIISEYNRSTMLEMMQRDSCTDSIVDQEKITQLRKVTEDYLAKYLSDKPSAWKWIVISCIYLTFICEEPMHPKEFVHYQEAWDKDKKIYYCPAKSREGITTCSYCVCRFPDKKM